MIKDKYSWIPKLPEAVLIKKPFYQMSDVEKKIYHLGYEKFRLIAELNNFRNSKVYKYNRFMYSFDYVCKRIFNDYKKGIIKFKREIA